MRVRVRGPDGASTITLGDSATVADLKQAITNSTSLSRFHIYNGPPKLLVLPEDSTLLSDLKVNLNGAVLTVSEKSGPSRSSQATPPSAGDVEKLVQSINVPKFAGMTEGSNKQTASSKHTHEDPKPIPLQKKKMVEDTPEVPLPDRGATLGMPSTAPFTNILSISMCAFTFNSHSERP